MEQFEEKRCLDGIWRLYAIENKDCWDIADELCTAEKLDGTGFPRIFATVPGNFELALTKTGRCPDLFFDVNTLEAQKYENRHLWYVVDFEMDREREPSGEYLLFEGVDTFATYYLNGKRIGHSDNMLIEHTFAAKGLVKGKNELVVHIAPTVLEARKHKFDAGVTCALKYNYGSVAVRKAAGMFGWDILPRIVSGGLWRSVYLCRDKKDRINDSFMYARYMTDAAAQTFYYSVDVAGDFVNAYTLEIKGVCGDSTFYRSETLWHTEGSFGIYVDNPYLWWPRPMGEPMLYHVTVRLLRGGKVCDTKEFDHGLRTVELIKTDYIDDDGNGDFRFKVNGEDFFVMGTNWVPLDAFPSREKERMQKACALLYDSGCNMIRIWGGGNYQDESLFDFCDQNGIAIWQDFMMGCAVYPQNEEFCDALTREAEAVVKKYRRHSSLFLWAGDNEVDQAMTGHRNPNTYIVTREVLPRVIERCDPCRVYLPSSPYVSQKAYEDNKVSRIPEDHLWGPRQYYKQNFYKNAVCRFASETGYHGCNSPVSVRRFIAPENLWPWQGNPAWIVHASSPELSKESSYAYRIPLMASHLKVLFGESVPDGLTDFALASQISQAEAFKYFIERFRCGKWERTGIIWWNLLDGWPQFSDAVVDYYFIKKLAYFVIKRCQEPVCVLMRDSKTPAGLPVLCAANETPVEKTAAYRVTDVKSGTLAAEGTVVIPRFSTVTVGEVPLTGEQTLLLIEYDTDGKTLVNHYLCGEPPYDFAQVVAWYRNAGLLSLEGFSE